LSEGEKSTGSNAFVVVIWAAVLLVVFVAFRGDDLLKWPVLFGNLGGGPLFGTGIIDSIIGAFAAAMLFVSWFGLGTFVLGFVRTERGDGDSHVLEFARNAAVGSVLWSLVWFFLGLLDAYDTAAAVVVTVVGIAFAAYSFSRIRSAKAESRTPETPAGIDKILLVLIAVCIVLAFVASLAPPIAKDTLLYHFAVPKSFIAQHGSAFIEGNIASYLALGTEMHVVWSMLLGGIFSPRAGEAAAGASVFLFFPMLLAVVFGWCRELDISRTWSLAAAFTIAAIPTAFHVASSGYIDLTLALYIALAVHSLNRYLSRGSSGSLVLIAVFLGGALAVKLTAVFAVAGIVLVVLLRARNSERAGAVVGSVCAAIIVAGVLASPWYLRNWAATGSPVFPFYMSIWPGEAAGWDVERSNLFQAMNSQYGGASEHPENYLTAPFRVSLAAQPEIPALYDGVLGAAFLIGLPLLIWAFWKGKTNAEIAALGVVSAVVYLFWLFTSEQLRYLLPIVPLIAVATAFAAEKVMSGSVRKAWHYSLSAASVLALLTSAAWFLQKSPLRVTFGGETRDAYLGRNLDYYSYYHFLNTETPAGAKVWLINMRRDTYNLDRAAVSDYLFEDQTFRKLLWESTNVGELREKAKALGVDHVLTRHDFLFDHDRSTLVDDSRPRAENDEKLRIAKEFILGPAAIRSDKKFSLVGLN
jgi:hypothetical protein